MKNTLGLCVLSFLFLYSPYLYGDEPPLINVKNLAPGIILEMRYATTNNFAGKKLYPSAECLLCEPAAKRLARVQKKLEKKGLGLKIWDCYRPLNVQKKLWNIVPDARYVANPKTGSRHNRGASIDLTLVDKNGKELLMPTPFDDFTKKAHRDYMNLPKNVLRNRQTLQDAMQSEGFMGLPTEWWHFDDPEWKNYAIRNEPLSSPALKKDKKSKLAHTQLPKEAKQLILVLSESWTSKDAVLKRFERKGNKWKAAGKSWRVVLGPKGMGWAQGLHTPTQTGPHKKEEDKRAPAGIFKLGEAYGYGKNSPGKWPYTQVDSTYICVDDPKSAVYNRIISTRDNIPKDYKSYEKMKRRDGIYKWVINIEQNYPAVLKGAGSCLFLHIWRKPGKPTLGCTAMKENQMVEILTWLKPSAKPHIVQLPRNVYQKVKKKWKLP